MKAIIFILSAAMILISLAGSQSFQSCEVSQNAKAFELGGFANRDDFDTYHNLIEDQNTTTAREFLSGLIQTGSAIMFEKGETVYAEGSEGDTEAMHVRRPGETQAYWLFNDAVNCT